MAPEAVRQGQVLISKVQRETLLVSWLSSLWARGPGP